MYVTYTAEQRRLLNKELGQLFEQESVVVVNAAHHGRLIKMFLLWFSRYCYRQDTLRSACKDLIGTSTRNAVCRDWLDMLANEGMPRAVYDVWQAMTDKRDPIHEHNVVFAAFKIMHDVMTSNLGEEWETQNNRTEKIGQSLSKKRFCPVLTTTPDIVMLHT